jgi:hypothetical protein
LLYACVDQVGQKVFNALYLLMQMSSQQGDSSNSNSRVGTPRGASSNNCSNEKAKSSSSSSSSQDDNGKHSIAPGGEATPRGLGEQLQQAMVRILPPAEAPGVISLMFKLMYMEGRLAADGVEG